MRKLLILALILGLGLAPPAMAAPEPGDSAQFGVVVTGIDGRFQDAVTVNVHPDVNMNRPGPDGRDVPHLHFWTLPPGGLESLVGKGLVVSVQGVQDERGKHWYVYGLTEVGPQEALGITDAEGADNYFHGGDVERARETGCEQVGSTEAGRGNSAGDCRGRGD